MKKADSVKDSTPSETSAEPLVARFAMFDVSMNFIIAVFRT